MRRGNITQLQKKDTGGKKSGGRGKEDGKPAADELC